MTMTNERGIANEINVTPLIDILLVLLIVFMVITPLTPRGLDALIPQPPDKRSVQQEQRTVVIHLSRGVSGEVLHINGEQVAWNSIAARLTAIFATRADKVAFVTADPDLDFERVAAVIDVAHAAGIDKIGLITSRLENSSTVSR
jgi:biopolymer transport protein TolR